MSKTYEHIEDEPMMAGESVAEFAHNRDDVSIAISGEELKNRLRQNLYNRLKLLASYKE